MNKTRNRLEHKENKNKYIMKEKKKQRSKSGRSVKRSKKRKEVNKQRNKGGKMAQDMQCTYNVSFRRVCLTVVAVEML